MVTGADTEGVVVADTLARPDTLVDELAEVLGDGVGAVVIVGLADKLGETLGELVADMDGVILGDGLAVELDDWLTEGVVVIDTLGVEEALGEIEEELVGVGVLVTVEVTDALGEEDVDALGEELGVEVIDTVGVDEKLGEDEADWLGVGELVVEEVTDVLVLGELEVVGDAVGFEDVLVDGDGAGDGSTHKVATISVILLTNLSKSSTNVYRGSFVAGSLDAISLRSASFTSSVTPITAMVIPDLLISGAATVPNGVRLS